MHNVLITGFGPDLRWQADEITLLNGIANVRVLNPLSRNALLDAVRDVDAIMTDVTRIDETVFKAAKNLKIVSEYGVGVDNIDLESATRHHVCVCNVPDVYTGNVAEHTLMLMMACARRMLPAMKTVKADGVWSSEEINPIRLAGKRLGLIGCGRIGLAFLKKCIGLELETVVCDPYLAKDGLNGVCARLISLDELIATCDMISIHAPLTKETRGLLNRKLFAHMKRGAVIINVSRGGIIDEHDLLWALDAGIVSAAGLDVVEGEPNIEQCPLKSHPNVIITPHMGWKSETAGREIELGCAENVRIFFAEGQIRNLCNRAVLSKE